MNTFSIDTDNNITAHAGLPASAENLPSFATAKDLAKLAADWPASRLIEVWNGFAGAVPFDDLKPVKRFTSRKAAVARIWQAVQRLAPEGAEQTRDVAPPAATAAPAKPRPRKGAPQGKRRDMARPGADIAREGSKKAGILALMRRAKGVTLQAIMEHTGWQAHTVRGFISGTLTRKMRLKVESFRTDNKERAYRIKS